MLKTFNIKFKDTHNIKFKLNRLIIPIICIIAINFNF